MTIRLINAGCGLVLALMTGSGWAAAQICEEPFSRPSYPTRQTFCAIGDILTDAYEPGRLIRCEEMEVDHLISLRQAWASGVCGKELKQLANDPRNLRFTHWLTNRRKGYLSPEIFADRLSPEVASEVRRDARALMRDYGIMSPENAMRNRMLAVANRRLNHTSIPIARVPKEIRGQMTFRENHGRIVVFIGRKAVGFATGVETAIDGISLAIWAADWLMTPAQSNRMKARAEMLKGLFGESQ